MSRPATIGDRLREILTELRITQREAAERAGVDPSTINDIVQNRRPRVSADLLKRILDGIGPGTRGRDSGPLPGCARCSCA